MAAPHSATSARRGGEGKEGGGRGGGKGLLAERLRLKCKFFLSFFAVLCINK